MDKATILSALRRVKPELERKHELSEIALFGSYSRGEQTLESDIDLMLAFEKIIAKNFFHCAYELKDLFAGKKTQVVLRDGIKPKYFEAISPDLVYA